MLKRAVADRFRYTTMTVVQARSIPVSLGGVDVLTKARTGTGKTLAFLIPALHRALVHATAGVSILIVSPTRELAQQIADEAGMLSTYLPNFRLQIVYGGTSTTKDVSAFRAAMPQLLVATPGRLVDHLRNSKSGFRQGISSLDVLILDEADRLLDMGFAEDINTIFEHIPPPSARQTLLFSATLPNNVQAVAKRALKPAYELIDCVGSQESTHEHVAQSVVVQPVSDVLPTLCSLLANCMQVADYKIIVFFPTARQTQLCAEVFAEMGRPVLEMHSRKSQAVRARVSTAFRTGCNVVMFTSDVTARGMDYPEVTSVVQVGLPSDREQYIHRIGRTGRAGKGGCGILLVTHEEAAAFLPCVDELGISRVQNLDEGMLDAMRAVSQTAVRRVDQKTKELAYQAWLGFYNSNLRVLGWSREVLVERAREWAMLFAGLDDAPELSTMIAGKMGLRRVAGLRVGAPASRRGARARGVLRGRGRARGRDAAPEEERHMRNHTAQGFESARGLAGRPVANTTPIDRLAARNEPDDRWHPAFAGRGW